MEKNLKWTKVSFCQLNLEPRQIQKKLFFAFSAGDVQQLTTYENAKEIIAESIADLEAEYLGAITEATQAALASSERADDATDKANISAQNADEATQKVNESMEAIKGAVQGTLINDDTPSENTTFSGKHIDDKFLKKDGDSSNTTVTFEQAAERANINPGDSLAIAFGKLAKFYSELRPYVFSDPVNNFDGTDPYLPAAAPTVKQLKEELDESNSKIPQATYLYKKLNGIADVRLRSFGDVVDLELRITASSLTENLPMKNKYYTLEAFEELKDLMSKRSSSLIKYVTFSSTYVGQINILNTGIIQLGYLKRLDTLENSDWPSTASMYLDITFIC